MGKQVSVIQFVGRTGELVGARSIKGDNITRVHRATIANPNTILQQTQRTKFLAVTNFGTQVPKDAIKGLLPYSKSNRCSLRNAVTKLYLKDPSRLDPSGTPLVNVHDDGTLPGEEMYAEITKALAYFSKGPLPKPNYGPLQADNPLQVDVTDYVAGGIDRSRTNLVIVLWSEAGFITETHPLPASGNLTVSVEVPQNWNGMKAHVYTYYQGFDSADKRNVYYSAIGMGAVSSAKALETSAEYSETCYNGSVTVQ